MVCSTPASNDIGQAVKPLHPLASAMPGEVDQEEWRAQQLDDATFGMHPPLVHPKLAELACTTRIDNEAEVLVEHFEDEAHDVEERQQRHLPEPILSLSLGRCRDRGCGATVEVTEYGFLRIGAIQESGPISAYNRHMPESRRVKQGDVIVEVNGSQGHATWLKQELRRHDQVRLGIFRPQSFTIGKLRKAERHLGVDIVCIADGTAIYIANIHAEGLLRDFNVCNPASAVRRGDMIVAVNGQVGVVTELARVLKDAEEIELTIAHVEGAQMSGLDTSSQTCS